MQLGQLQSLPKIKTLEENNRSEALGSEDDT